MGWANCGTDDAGRPIGYAHEATCDHPGCDEKIDRGLAFACGGMHGNGEWYCDRYFCGEHLTIVTAPVELDISNGLCEECYSQFSAAYPDCEECGGWSVHVTGNPESINKPCDVCRKRGIFKSEINWEETESYEEGGLKLADWQVFNPHPDIEDSTCVCGAGKGEPCRGVNEDGNVVVISTSMIHIERVAA